MVPGMSGLAELSQNNCDARFFMERMRPLCPLFFLALIFATDFLKLLYLVVNVPKFQKMPPLLKIEGTHSLLFLHF